MERIDQERYEVTVQLDDFTNISRMEFLNKSKTFGSEYDMHGVGSKKRYEEAKITVTKLEEQLDTLKKGTWALVGYDYVHCVVAEISEGQREKDKMMALQQQVALMEDDVAKEKGRMAGKNIKITS